MMKRLALIFVGHYLPGFRMGGPLRSIVNLVDHLHHEFDFRIVTTDRDLGDMSPYNGIRTDRWEPVGKAQVRYVPPGEQRLSNIARIMRSTPHDVLYLNSFFSPRFTVLPLVARRLKLASQGPMVIAPRGEFSEGALALKGAKKRAYLAVGKMAGLFSGAVWQASSEREAANIRAALGDLARDIHIAVNLASPLASQPQAHQLRSPGAPLRILFLGRISPMKNLDYALRVLNMVKAPVEFSIFGPPEDAAYKAECEQLATSLPKHIEVHWRGAIEPAEVPRAMADHDLFFLPTRGENFGHVISEALGAGTPVLLADTTPWRGMAQAGIGHDLPLSDPSSFAAAIEAAAQQSPGDARAHRERAFAYARERQLCSDDVEANRQLFYAALNSRRSAPTPQKEGNS